MCNYVVDIYIFICTYLCNYSHVYAYGPKTSPAFLRFFAFGSFGVKCGVGGCNNVLCNCVFSTHMMLRWTHLISTGLHAHDVTLETSYLYWVARTWCYAGHVLSLLTLLCCTHMLLRWTRLISTSLHAHDVTLDTSYRYFVARTWCYAANVLSLLRSTHMMLQWTRLISTGLHAHDVTLTMFNPWGFEQWEITLVKRSWWRFDPSGWLRLLFSFSGWVWRGKSYLSPSPSRWVQQLW